MFALRGRGFFCWPSGVFVWLSPDDLNGSGGDNTRNVGCFVADRGYKSPKVFTPQCYSRRWVFDRLLGRRRRADGRSFGSKTGSFSFLFLGSSRRRRFGPGAGAVVVSCARKIWPRLIIRLAS